MGEWVGRFWGWISSTEWERERDRVYIRESFWVLLVPYRDIHRVYSLACLTKLQVKIFYVGSMIEGGFVCVYLNFIVKYVNQFPVLKFVFNYTKRDIKVGWNNAWMIWKKGARKKIRKKGWLWDCGWWKGDWRHFYFLHHALNISSYITFIPFSMVCFTKKRESSNDKGVRLKEISLILFF